MICSNCACNVASSRHPPAFDNADVISSDSLSNLTADLLLLERMVLHLNERRMLLKHKINAHSPIGRLPEELLIEIFSECDPIPFYLGSVCKDWRTIIWRTPLLWNSVSIHIRWDTPSSKCDLLKQWLHRAETSPLHLKVTAESDCDEGLYDIFNVIASRAAFWASIEFVIPSPAHELFENCVFPLLTSATLRPATSTLTTFFTEPPKMFDAAPNLIHLDLLGYNMPPEGVRWSQLRKLKSQALKVPDLLDVMRCSPSLVECHAQKIYGTIDDFEAIDDTLQHLNLTCLDISLLSTTSLPLLDAITLPSLRQLSVTYHGGQGSVLMPIAALIERSACTQLRELYVEEPRITLTDLIFCLKVTPLLETLSVIVQQRAPFFLQGGGRMGGELVQVLNPKDGDPFLPRLTSVRYHGPTHSEVAKLAAMLRERLDSEINESPSGTLI